MKKRTGSVYKRGNGTWWARATFTDITGKRRQLQRRADSKSHACAIRDDLLRQLAMGLDPDADRKTFADLAHFYRANYLIPAQYVDGRKVAGMRSLITYQGFMHVLETYFGERLLSAIRYEDLREYRLRRLQAPTRFRSQRTIASVNRELSFLRRILNVAVRKGWLLRNPFERGEALISPADERSRERILSPEEETRLLAACEAPERRHLRPIVVCALDTGMRRGEIFKMRWSDVDLERRAITVQAFNSKVLRARSVPITARLARELGRLERPSASALVFGITSNVKRSFRGACRDARLEGLRFHDLRHSCATRLVRGHLPLAEVGRVLGHTQTRTTFRYVNMDGDTIDRAATILDVYGSNTTADGELPAVN